MMLHKIYANMIMFLFAFESLVHVKFFLKKRYWMKVYVSCWYNYMDAMNKIYFNKFIKSYYQLIF